MTNEVDISKAKLRELFDDWFDAKAFVISETSGDMAKDYRKLVARAEKVAEVLGLAWVPQFMVPEYVADIIWWDNEDA